MNLVLFLARRESGQTGNIRGRSNAALPQRGRAKLLLSPKLNRFHGVPTRWVDLANSFNRIMK